MYFLKTACSHMPHWINKTLKTIIETLSIFVFVCVCGCVWAGSLLFFRNVDFWWYNFLVPFSHCTFLRIPFIVSERESKKNEIFFCSSITFAPFSTLQSNYKLIIIVYVEKMVRNGTPIQWEFCIWKRSSQCERELERSLLLFYCCVIERL